MKIIKKIRPLLRDFGVGVIMGFVILTALSAQIIWETM
jgi:hypothetical protein